MPGLRGSRPKDSVSTAGWRMAKRSRSRKLWQRLRIPRRATNSRYQAGIRTPRRIRASGIALRSLIRSRSVAAETLLSKRRSRFRRLHCMLTTQARDPVTDFDSALVFVPPLCSAAFEPMGWGLLLPPAQADTSPTPPRWSPTDWRSTTSTPNQAVYGSSTAPLWCSSGSAVRLGRRMV